MGTSPLLLAAPVLILYVGERVTSWVRRARIETLRAKAEYPTTGNDPVGRVVVF